MKVAMLMNGKQTLMTSSDTNATIYNLGTMDVIFNDANLYK